MKLKFEPISGLHISAGTELKYFQYIGILYSADILGEDVVEGRIKYMNDGFFYMQECNHGSLYVIELSCQVEVDEKAPKLVYFIYIDSYQDQNFD